ncbi:MAG: SDR family oxidoreductase [Acidimicrobiia bacterium]
MDMTGKRIWVVGASRGVGRVLALGLAAKGARVAFSARTTAPLDDAVAKVGNGAIAVPVDVTDESSIVGAAKTVLDAFGGLDVLIYAPAVGPLTRIEDADAELWRYAFNVNTIGATLVTRHVIAALAQSHGTAMYLSSIAEGGQAWPGLGLYATTKGALVRLIEAWRREHAEVAFTRMVLGPISGADIASEFGADWDPNLAVQFGTQWVVRGLHDGVSQIAGQDTVELAAVIIKNGSVADEIVIQPRPAPPQAV